MTNYPFVMNFWDSFNWDLYVKFLKTKMKSDENKLKKKIKNEKNQKEKKDKS